jgi:predicted dehydrogenase
LARSVSEADEMVEASSRSGHILWTGFNYRYMAHVRKAKELIEAEKLGQLYLFRSRYGHGGRPGYESSWCADAELSGGGVLLEQGIHILDQFRFLIAEPSETLTHIQRFFWNFPEVEDNCFCLLRAATGQVGQLHMSWTQWVNILEMEIFGCEGYLRLEGRDGHYGPQRLIWGRRKSDHSRPSEELFEFPSVDTSWEREWADFLKVIRSGSDPFPYALSGLRVQVLVDAAYRSSKDHAWVSVPKAEVHTARVA